MSELSDFGVVRKFVNSSHFMLVKSVPGVSPISVPWVPSNSNMYIHNKSEITHQLSFVVGGVCH